MAKKKAGKRKPKSQKAQPETMAGIVSRVKRNGVNVICHLECSCGRESDPRGREFVLCPGCCELHAVP